LSQDLVAVLDGQRVRKSPTSIYLSQVSDETGGEAYYLGFGAPVSFAPYLDDLSHRLTRQYLLTFLAKPEKKAGFQQFKLRTEVHECGVGRS
jgi:hypothetical protein